MARNCQPRRPGNPPQAEREQRRQVQAFPGAPLKVDEIAFSTWPLSLN